MRLSRFFLPILRETPKEAEIVSHRLMLRAGRLLADHAGAQHQAVRDDLGLFRRLAQDRQEEAGEAHGRGSDSGRVDEVRRSESGSRAKRQPVVGMGRRGADRPSR